MAEAVYLVSGSRTPQGSFLGSLSSLSAPELGATTIKATVSKAGVSTDAVDGVIMGCVLPAGIGQAPARQALRKAGLPDSVGATTINKVCGSGMKAVMLAAAEIAAGEASIMIAGGMESMSNAPHLLKTMRTGAKMGNQTLIDSMIHDGLWDPYGDMHMGNCAERCAEKYEFTREAQDAFSIRSFERAREAQAKALFDAEIAPVEIPQRKGDPVIVSTDEGPAKSDLSKLPGLRPAFEKTGTITAGNASTINDGAASVLVASQAAVDKHGLKPMAKIIASATHSQEPLWFTTAPVGAIQKALDKAGLTINDIDCFEINEAFALVTMVAVADLKLDEAKVNPRGGAVSLGHPIGATGARLLVTLMHTLKQTGGRYGLASLCIGGGEATAMIIENLL